MTEIQLRPGERDNSNLAYIEKLAEAWPLIQDHDVFRGIQSAAPLAITDDVADSGSQHAYELISYNAGTCRRLTDLHGRHKPVLD